MMNILIRSIAVALAFGIVLYQFTPDIAMGFYELYHLVHIEFVYLLYSATKFLSAYFMLWEWRALTSIIFGVVCGALYYWRKNRRQQKLQSSLS